MPRAVTLLWIPLGAGGVSIARNGRIYEALVARHARRPAQPLFHAALELDASDGPYVIELAPAWGAGSAGPGVVGTGPVGVAAAGRLRALRYELRVTAGGVIPDRDWAAAELVLSGDAAVADRIVALSPSVPRLTWGRDESGAGEMWNSNSVIAWLLDRAGIEGVHSLVPPDGGRAPGWSAGVVVAQRGPAPGRTPS